MANKPLNEKRVRYLLVIFELAFGGSRNTEVKELLLLVLDGKSERAGSTGTKADKIRSFPLGL